MQSIEILNVRFDKITLDEATEIALKFANSEKQHYITTPNPEILLKAQKDSEYREILNKSDLNIADGTGILWAAGYCEEKGRSKGVISWILSLVTIPFKGNTLKSVLPDRVTGTDLMRAICKKTTKRGERIFFLGARSGVAEKLKEKYEKKYPGTTVVGTHAGSPELSEEKGIVEKINNSGAQILFIAYGAPAQEKWISRNLQKMPKVKLAIGVGGAFNFEAGIIKRAPKWMRSIGLEWLHRLIRQPSRIKRIYNAIMIFPIKVLNKEKK